MKKLMTACAVALVAAMANAAAVTWSSGTYTDGFKNPSNAKMTTAMGYEMIVSIFSDSTGSTLVTSSNSSSVNAMTGAISTTTADVLASDKTYYIKAVISDGTNVRDTDIYSFTTPSTGNAMVNFTTGAGIGGSSGWNTWTTTTPEPEPTSALLMVFGLAGLVLRRKRA